MIAIIGAGVAGLACAKSLSDAGKDFVIFEAADAVGGRVRTDHVDGFTLDRGFQVLLTAYPEAQNLLDYERLNLINLPSGARIRHGREFSVMPNPLKNPLKAPQALFTSVATLFDKAKILELAFKTSAGDEPSNTSAETESTREFLKNFGFSDQVFENFFAPFFGGVFLEKELATRADLFKFLFAMFGAGEAAIPAGGMQKIPEQIAEQLNPERIRLNTCVRKIDAQTIYLESGETVEAEKIVVAADQTSAARLLGEARPEAIAFNGTTCFYFACDKESIKFADEPYLLINANRHEKINHLLIASAAAPSYAPAGKTLVSVNVVGESEVSENEIESELSDWFGGEISWYHLKTYRIPQALPQFFGGEASEKNLKLNENLYRCGDYAAYPSLNAAMKTGRLVAEMLARN